MNSLLSVATCGLLLVACLGACGGGGGGGGGFTPTVPTEMTTAELQLAQDCIDAMNQWRAQQNPVLAPLTWYAPGAQVAFEHSAQMEAHGFFAHVDPNTNKDPATRALDAGITHDPGGSIDPHSNNPFVGENIYGGGGGTASGQAAVNSWAGSPGHNTQMVAPNPVAGAQTMPAWTHVGIGVRNNGGAYWFTAMFFRNPN